MRLGEGTPVAVSPDGKWVLTSQIRTTPPTLVLLPTGAGAAEDFPEGRDRPVRVRELRGVPSRREAASCSTATKPGKPIRVFVQSLDGGAARPVTPEGVAGRLLSPDGKFLLTQSARAGIRADSPR